MIAEYAGAHVPFLEILAPRWTNLPEETRLLLPHRRILQKHTDVLYERFWHPDKLMRVDWSNPAYPTGTMASIGRFGRYTGAELWVKQLEEARIESPFEDYNNLWIPHNWQTVVKHWKEGGQFEYQTWQGDQFVVEYYGDKKHQKTIYLAPEQPIRKLPFRDNQ